MATECCKETAGGQIGCPQESNSATQVHSNVNPYSKEPTLIAATIFLQKRATIFLMATKSINEFGYRSCLLKGKSEERICTL